MLALYARPYDSRFPVVCFDERPCFLIGDVVEGLAPQPGKPAKEHYAYTKHGSCCVLAAVEPLAARIHPAVESVAWEAWGMWLAGLAGTLLVAAVYDRWIDAPVQRYLNRRLFGQTPVSAVRPARHPAPEPSA